VPEIMNGKSRNKAGTYDLYCVGVT
jgi:hypothetical protein